MYQDWWRRGIAIEQKGCKSIQINPNWLAVVLSILTSSLTRAHLQPRIAVQLVARFRARART